jgi:hypothetical protein
MRLTRNNADSSFQYLLLLIVIIVLRGYRVPGIQHDLLAAPGMEAPERQNNG